VIQVNETKGWLLAVRLSLCEEKKGSRISTWTQSVSTREPTCGSFATSPA
jgi:hypothetical protein